MAVATTIKLRDVWGTRKAIFATLAFDSSYPTGGEAINLDDVEISNVDYVIFPEANQGFIFEWDDANSKVKVFQFNYPGAAAGAATEVPATTNLAALTAVRAIFVGEW